MPITGLALAKLSNRLQRADTLPFQAIFGGDHETSPSTISASGRGRCRAAGHVACRDSASLSDAADPTCHSFSPGWCIRRRRTPVGGQGETLLGTVVVENSGGASGSLGAAAVARARP